MNLKRQLLLVSLLTLVLPWAGYQFIHETESALRVGQQQMLAGTARAIADSLAQYPEEFPSGPRGDETVADQLYVHPLGIRPEIDGYFHDWGLERESLRELRGVHGPVYISMGVADESVFLYAEVRDRSVVYAQPGSRTPASGPTYFDAVSLVNTSPLYLNEEIVFAAEAPGPVIPVRSNDYGIRPDPAIIAAWQDTSSGYQVEARIPLSKLGTHIGIVVSNTADASATPARSASFTSRRPGAFISVSPELDQTAANLTQAGMRLIVTDASGWRIALNDNLVAETNEPVSVGSRWLRIAYDALVETAAAAQLAEPDPSGRERRDYVSRALDGEASAGWFRSPESDRAVVAVAQPVVADGEVVGAFMLQQSTDAILSLRNEGLVRLMNVTLIATLLVAATLLGYATWLSRRIRRLSVAAEDALDSDDLRTALPSAGSGDEVGDLSRSFSHVLRQLGDYNDYLRSLASKLSHELRTPLAIVTSSLENLEHEPLNEASAGYAARARDGADRLRRILTAMSEASRVEELMANAEPEAFDLRAVLESTVAAYRDVYPQRDFELDADLETAPMSGSPELLIQMLDKLVDNAVGFSDEGDVVTVGLSDDSGMLCISVANPGPPLPDRMRYQMFDSMVSMRPGKDNKHLGLGLYVARLIAEGHGGKIDAENIEGGVSVFVTLPGEQHGE
ncbi:MAG: ATP-binding protein [Woeseiaceae bacterium]|nr:ATP-binding protein [Woeseiaceae bacterium]